MQMVTFFEKTVTCQWGTETNRTVREKMIFLLRGLVIYAEIEPGINLGGTDAVANTDRLRLKAQKTSFFKNYARAQLWAAVDAHAQRFTK